MKIKIDNYKRKALFEQYDSYTNPFASITTKLDITNIYTLCKESGHFYATMGYYLSKAMNDIDEFKVTYDDGEFYIFDAITPSYTDIRPDETIGFYDVPLTATYEEYITSYDEAKKKFLAGESEPPIDGAYVWLSCEPWFKASAICPPSDKEKRIPQLIWDRYEIENGRCYVNLMIFFHHGFIDGFHIGKLLNKMEEYIASIA